MKWLLCVYLLIPIQSMPISDEISTNKLAFSLAQPEEDVIKTEKKPGLLGMLHDISENSYFKDFMSLMKVVADGVQTTTVPPVVAGRRAKAFASPSVPSAHPVPLDDSPAGDFHASFSMDDAGTRLPAAPKVNKSITNEEWAHTLFGERGVLTGVFQMMDQQRKAAKNTQSDVATVGAAAPGAPQGNKQFDADFKKIFDSLLMGSSKGEFGDPGPELPEFLGICNRLSCGDIYKAVDKFRRSEFFSNFQTALTLVQDPNGWETIGKLLSNPELISQFTAGSGMEELFGSALGEAKKESTKNKDKNSKLLPEDGDFGTDFTDLEEGGRKTEGKKAGGEGLPEIDFSIDSKPETGDYYAQVVTQPDTDETPPDYEDLVGVEEEKEEKGMASTTVEPVPIPIGKSVDPDIPVSTAIGKSIEGGEVPPLPELSFSVDGAPDETEAEVIETTIDVAPPPKRNSVHSGGLSVPIRTLIHRSSGSSSSKLEKGAVTRTTRPTQTTTIRPTTTRVINTMRPAVSTTRRTTTSTTTMTTTTKNYRKDSDYYAMYYDEQPK